MLTLPHKFPCNKTDHSALLGLGKLKEMEEMELKALNGATIWNTRVNSTTMMTHKL